MSFDEDDVLGRKKYSQFLAEIIRNSTKYKRASDSESFTLAIDSAWGTGKTTFIEKWITDLKKIKNEIGEKEYIIIKYSAWENDFFDDCIQSLLYTVLIDDSLDEENDTRNIKKIIKDGSVTFAKIAVKGILKKILTPEDAKELIESTSGVIDSIKGIKKSAFNDTSFGDNFDQYKKYIDLLDNFKKIMNKVTSKNKIIIIIDELDRCKPTFAIQLLEIIKHIFDIKNIVFIFSLDMSQLGYSIKTVYGQEIDSSGYLCRFFDYISKIPPIDTDLYIEHLLQNKPLINKDLGQRIFKNSNYIDIDFKYIFKTLSKIYSLSLRDINTIYSNFQLFENFELKNNRNIRAYELYLVLLIMKYKDSECFNNIFRNTSNKGIFDNDFIKKLQKLEQDNFKAISFISYINGKILKENNFQKMEENTQNVSNNFIVERNEKCIYYKEGYMDYKIQYNEKINISNILFYEDVENWDEIKEMTMKEFLNKKLEFFNFYNETEQSKL